MVFASGSRVPLGQRCFVGVTLQNQFHRLTLISLLNSLTRQPEVYFYSAWLACDSRSAAGRAGCNAELHNETGDLTTSGLIELFKCGSNVLVYKRIGWLVGGREAIPNYDVTDQAQSVQTRCALHW
jgi:hypothetical protein